MDMPMPSFENVVHRPARTIHRSPTGSQHQCGAANQRLREIIDLAKSAWLSSNPTTKEHRDFEYRKHPQLERYFYLKQEGVYLDVRELYHDNTTMELLVQRYPAPENAWIYPSILRLLDPGNEIVAHPGSHWQDFLGLGEWFVTEGARPHRFSHRCFDGSVKQLYDSPDTYLHHSSTHETTRLAVYLSAASTAFQEYFNDTHTSPIALSLRKARIYGSAGNGSEKRF